MATPRLPHGVRTAWGEFIGPEATATDTSLALGLGAAGAVAAPHLARGQLERYERVILRLLALDLWGGAWVNNTKACARWYERPGQSDTDHLAFASLHIHPAVLAWMDRDEPRRVPGWVWAGAHYSYLMAATILIRRNAARRRLLGPALTLGGLALDAMLGPSRAAPWFAPVFYTKLLLGQAAAALWSDAALSGSTILEAATHPRTPSSLS